MAQEKTEKATPRRRRKAREDGQVAKSREMTMALALLFVLSFLFVAFPLGFNFFQNFMFHTFSGDLTFDFTIPNVHQRSLEIMFVFALIVLPVLFVAALAGVIAELMQVGFMFTTKMLAPKLDRLDPIKGFQRIISKRALVELTKSILKATIFVVVSYLILQPALPMIVNLPQIQLEQALIKLANIIIRIGFFSVAFQLVIGLADFFYQRYEFEKKIRMSKQDIKDEYKETEGDPQIQSKIKQRQREMSQQRMLADVPDSDVIITNPTHIAVAIKYEQGNMEAPKVVAKGKDALAKRICDLAKEHKIEIIREKVLAQTLYKSTEVGQEIPPDLYQAVAEILAFVYRLQRYY